MHKRKGRPKPSGTLGDRTAFAFGTGFLAFVLGSTLWALLNFRYAYRHTIPYDYVLYFVAVMAALAFLYCENVIVEVLAGLIEGILEPEERAPPWWLLLIVALVVVAVGWYFLG